MTFAHILLYFTLLSQTKIYQATQTSGTTLVPNNFTILTEDSNGKVQIFPGPFFYKTLQIEAYTVPVSGARCGRNFDGESHPVYEFGKPGSVVFSTDYMYICTPQLRWKRILLENF